MSTREAHLLLRTWIARQTSHTMAREAWKAAWNSNGLGGRNGIGSRVADIVDNAIVEKERSSCHHIALCRAGQHGSRGLSPHSWHEQGQAKVQDMHEQLEE